jgi:hypothetical protein
MSSTINPEAIQVEPRFGSFALDVREQFQNAKDDIQTILTEGVEPDLSGWTFSETGAKSISQPVSDGQFYFRQMASPAAFRAQGLGSITGFMCSAFQTPVQFVFHCANGTGNTGEELPVTNAQNLFTWDTRGTINNVDGQGSAFQMRVTTKEDTATTGTIGSTVKMWVAPLGGTVSVANPATLSIDDDNGLSFKGVQFVDGSGSVISSGSSTPNLVTNPSFDHWQGGTSFAIAANTTTQLADRYKTRRAAAGTTFSQQTGFLNAAYCIRMARDSGNTSTQALLLFQHFDPDFVRKIAGKTVTVSYDARVGANYSGGALVASFYSGTAGGEALTMVGAGAGFTTGAVAGSNINMGTPTTTAARLVGTSTYTIPSDARDLAFRTYWSPTGTAGAADYLEITNIRIAEVGTEFVPVTQVTDLNECMRFYRKSFLPATTPAQNVGAGTGEIRFPAITAAATVQRPPSVRFGAPMRSTPTITLYNPAAANGEARDITATADCSSTSSTNVSVNGFDLLTTGNASTSIGNSLGIHWTADARL